MPALVAIRHNPVLKALYERLVNNGKPKKSGDSRCHEKIVDFILWRIEVRKTI